MIFEMSTVAAGLAAVMTVFGYPGDRPLQRLQSVGASVAFHDMHAPGPAQVLRESEGDVRYHQAKSAKSPVFLKSSRLRCR